ncbi:hypothetical protein GOBAR_AA12216 [Gossypium barbadense]|uniref:Uncharacterized protein n=1 Tax=Gossypium barbadense TaxID=3634 RepID=A0A2P5XYQ7_GOSBA|nr:hypothetical protein GOBAR_AA12216 [Gossypium barbadense]
MHKALATNTKKEYISVMAPIITLLIRWLRTRATIPALDEAKDNATSQLICTAPSGGRRIQVESREDGIRVKGGFIDRKEDDELMQKHFVQFL